MVQIKQPGKNWITDNGRKKETPNLNVFQLLQKANLGLR